MDSSSNPPHSKDLRRGRSHQPGAVFSVTTVVQDRRPLIGATEARRIIEALQWLRREGRIRLYAFVVMPDHMHALIEPLAGYFIEDVMRAWKQHSAREIQKLQGTRGVFWQEGFFDHSLRDEEDARRQVQYIAENPVRSGLVQVASSYPYSSANPSLAGLVDPLLI